MARGRKRKESPDVKRDVIKFRVNQEIREELEYLANFEDGNMSKTLIDLIEKEVNRRRASELISDDIFGRGR